MYATTSIFHRGVCPVSHMSGQSPTTQKLKKYKIDALHACRMRLWDIKNVKNIWKIELAVERVHLGVSMLPRIYMTLAWYISHIILFCRAYLYGELSQLLMPVMYWRRYPILHNRYISSVPHHRDVLASHYYLQFLVCYSHALVPFTIWV